MMIVRDLKKAYGKESSRVEVLKGINLTINNGETVALVGKSGSGKSTLLSLLAGLDSPDSGEIVIDDYNRCCFFFYWWINFVFCNFHIIIGFKLNTNILKLFLIKQLNFMH